jgi:hypothetical protein
MLVAASGFVLPSSARVNAVILREKINQTIDLESPKVVHTEKLDAGTAK